MMGDKTRDIKTTSWRERERDENQEGRQESGDLTNVMAQLQNQTYIKN